MNLSQQLSGFAKTFRSALLTRWRGFCDSELSFGFIKRTYSNVDDNLLPLATAFGLRWKDLKVISKEVRDRTGLQLSGFNNFFKVAIKGKTTEEVTKTSSFSKNFITIYIFPMSSSMIKKWDNFWSPRYLILQSATSMVSMLLNLSLVQKRVLGGSAFLRVLEY